MAGVEFRLLGKAARDYIRDHLSNVNTFCTALLQTFLSEAGDVFTLAPAGTSDARLEMFTRGGLLRENVQMKDAIELPDGSVLMPVTSLIKTQTELIRSAMPASENAVCIADDFNPTWSYWPPAQRASHLGKTAFGVGDEVYHLVSRDLGEADFANAVGCGHVIWHGVVAVCRDSVRLDERRETTAEDLKRCAASVLMFTCVAYDGEGFVAWRRTSGLSRPAVGEA